MGIWMPADSEQEARIAAQKAYQAAYFQRTKDATRDRRLEAVRQWKASNHEKVREYKRRYYIEHREQERIKDRVRRKRIRASDPEKHRSYSRAKYHKDPAKKAEQMKRYKERDPEKFREMSNKKRLSHVYGLTPEEVESMRVSQGGVCKTLGCGSDGTDTKHGKLCIDHCHATGKVRGLLCSRCNSGLGFFKDNPALLRAAADYLEESK